jgi:hypothetical protein
VLGFPVHVDLSFVLIIGLIGYSPSRGVRDLVLWVVIATLAVLAHELGHAVAARSVGAQPQIALVGFGGLTTFTPPQPLSRARSLGISLAGPGVGLALGLPLLLGWLTVRDQLDPGLAGLAMVSGMVTAWAGACSTCPGAAPGRRSGDELLPGDPGYAAAGRPSSRSSLPGSGGAAYLFGMLFALFMLFFGLNNARALRRWLRPPGRPAWRPDRDVVAQPRAVHRRAALAQRPGRCPPADGGAATGHPGRPRGARRRPRPHR